MSKEKLFDVSFARSYLEMSQTMTIGSSNFLSIEIAVASSQGKSLENPWIDGSKFCGFFWGVEGQR